VVSPILAALAEAGCDRGFGGGGFEGAMTVVQRDSDGGNPGALNMVQPARPKEVVMRASCGVPFLGQRFPVSWG
jgi:hypothetical protein